MKIKVSNHVWLPESDLDIKAIRAQGAGGQNVNKVSSAVHLRFDIQASSLPLFYKERLLLLRDQRISSDGIIVIKAQQSRSQEKNRAEAIERLLDLIRSVAVFQKKRIPTRPSRSSQRKRLDGKTRHSKTKAGRGKVDY